MVVFFCSIALVMSHGKNTKKWNFSSEHLDAFPEKPIRKRNKMKKKKTLFKICMCFLRLSFNSLYWRTIYNFFAWQLLFLFGFVLFFFLSFLSFFFSRVDWFDVGVSKSFLFGSILFERTLQCANITIGLVLYVSITKCNRGIEWER